MAISDKEVIFTRRVRVACDAVLELKTIKTSERDHDGYSTLLTYGTVVYDDGERCELDPVIASDSECYLWQGGFIFRVQNRSFHESVFNIENRFYKKMKLNYNQEDSLLLDSSDHNTSIKFYRIEELGNGNRLLVDRFWNDMDLLEALYFLHQNGNVHSLGLVYVCSPDEFKISEGTIWDEHNIYFYYWSSEDDITITRVIDKETGKEIYDYMDDYNQKDFKEGIKRMIKE